MTVGNVGIWQWSIFDWDVKKLFKIFALSNASSIILLPYWIGGISEFPEDLIKNFNVAHQFLELLLLDFNVSVSLLK